MDIGGQPRNRVRPAMGLAAGAGIGDADLRLLVTDSRGYGATGRWGRTLLLNQSSWSGALSQTSTTLIPVSSSHA
jgi:hypothetical protein